MSWLRGGFVLVGCLFASVLAQEAESSFSIASAPKQLSLAKGLIEISGLAAASESSVYAHNDEHGIVYELSLNDGKILSAFALGDPTVKGDFEGIAVGDGRIYLLTSSGLIYEAPKGANRERVKFNIFDTGVGAFCEAEGLAGAPTAGEFLILCKSAFGAPLENHLVIFRWSLSERLAVKAPWMTIPYTDFLAHKEARNFRPSAIEWDAEHKLMIILSARDKRLIAVGLDKRIAYTKKLPAKLHLQAEGAAIMAPGDLVIADEGAGRGPGKLSIYKAQR